MTHPKPDCKLVHQQLPRRHRLGMTSQVQRLIAVLSCRGVRKASLSDGAALLDGAAGAGGLSDGDLAALRGAGWRPGTTLRELLNYAGERPGAVS